ncbi:serine hydrolase domain-containing protein [Streptomyces sp. NPDC050560]|uniref:serine hydrolase domain-containing protein n=1 Tax=Streptomyces sp. NPDC050560 TaxID=3365630 RepID=UPI00378D15FA
MAELAVQAEPGELGFDAGRLARIDRYFARYLPGGDGGSPPGRLPGWLVVVARSGRIVHLSASGMRNVDEGLPVTTDTVWRLYSMTKPVTSLAAMMLYEEGALALTDPVSAYIPSFADPRVFRSGTDVRPQTVPATTPMTVWHLLTHTSGLTYGFHRAHPVDAILRARGFEWSTPPGYDLAASCDAWAQLPLLFQPGAEWNYSVATDVLGRVVEVASGLRLDDFFRTRIFEPLGMHDTGFHLGPGQVDRFAALYTPGPDGELRRAGGSGVTEPPSHLSGGGGLMGSAGDYHRFVQMLLGRGAYEGVRLLGSRTVDYMTRNHLPGGALLDTFARPLLSEVAFEGTGFGLGFSVVRDAAALHNLVSEGEFGWGGAASTAFWVDPAEEITVLFFTQLLPSDTYPLRSRLRALVNQALVD